MEIYRKITSSWRNTKLPHGTTFKLSEDIPLHNVLPWWEYQVICGIQAEIMDVLRFWAWRRILSPNSEVICDDRMTSSSQIFKLSEMFHFDVTKVWFKYQVNWPIIAEIISLRCYAAPPFVFTGVWIYLYANHWHIV